MIVVNAGDPRKPACPNLTGRAGEIYHALKDEPFSPDWMLATLCSMQAIIEKQQETINQLNTATIRHANTLDAHERIAEKTLSVQATITENIQCHGDILELQVNNNGSNQDRIENLEQQVADLQGFVIP